MPKAARATAAAGASSSGKHLVGDALYAWCQAQHQYGYVITQDELLDSNIIPNRSLDVLLQAAQYLVSRHLFRVHDVKGQTGSAYELVKPETAQSYNGLTQDEHMVYAAIEAAGTQGLWTKTIKAKLSAHAKVLDRVYKSLESKQLIKQMKSVKNPGRKMYISYLLQPSEDATGGAWFTEGRLDVEMIDAVSGFVEQFCSKNSWREVEDSDSEDENIGRKRKQPDDGFDETGNEKGKGKTAKHEVESKNGKRKIPQYRQHHPGYLGYPTIQDVSREILRSQLIESGQALPDNALSQLMQVMVYDDRLYKMHRPPKAGETPDDPINGTVTMYRSFQTLHDLHQEANLRKKLINGSRSAARAQEIEDIGLGGSSEVPCMSCANFDICGDGGPINAETCVYMDDWFTKMEDADRQTDDPWPAPYRPSKKSAHQNLRKQTTKAAEEIVE